jgi:alpha-ketoglutaric semialdehyde dehydrogenase
MYVKPNARAVTHVGPSLIGFNWIGGRELEGDLPSFESRSAADRRDIIGIFPEAGERDVEKACRAAAEAFRSWQWAPDRGTVLPRLAAILGAQRERLARLLTRESGRTPARALAEVDRLLETCGELQTSGPATPNLRARGVIGLLSGATFPLALPGERLLEALLAGNTVVWKPSENASGIAYLLTRCLMDAGLPPGVVNVLHGKGRAGCGKFLPEAIDKGLFQGFCFQGSRSRGRALAEACARAHVPCHLDLWGTQTQLVLGDADLETAAAQAVQAAFTDAGQTGTSLTNILLLEPVAAEFRARFLALVAALRVGNPVADAEVSYGPLANARMAHRFEAHWEAGCSEGATLASGGLRLSGEEHPGVGHGEYMAPTVWEDVLPGMDRFRMELLGPAVNLVTVPDLSGALAAALAAPAVAWSLWTRDPDAVARVQRDATCEFLATNAACPDWNRGRLPGGFGAAISRGQTLLGPGPLPSPLRVEPPPPAKYEPTAWDRI